MNSKSEEWIGLKYMPEYSQVQTYVKLNRYNLKNVVMELIDLFHVLEVDIEPIKSDLCNLSWEACKKGTARMHFSCDSSRDLVNKRLHLKPYIIIWSPDEHKKINDPWIEISCLLRTQEIMSDAEVGIYLTDEVTDGQPWEVLLEDGTNFWCFNAAIIPEEYGHLYMNVPLDFTQYRVDEKTYIIYTSFWNKIPWKNEGYEE